MAVALSLTRLRKLRHPLPEGERNQQFLFLRERQHSFSLRESVPEFTKAGEGKRYGCRSIKSHSASSNSGKSVAKGASPATVPGTN